MKLLDKENILYLDNHVIVVDKAVKILTQPADGHDDNLEDMVKAYLKEVFNKPGNVFLHAIHRLDKEVSGLVLFARSSKALTRLNEASRERLLERYYIAKVSGNIELKKGILSHYLKHGSHRAVVSDANDIEAKRADLEYEVLDYNDGISTVKIKLITGRYHQIRAQFALINHPIIGDKKYGSNVELDRILLHHYLLIFTHPVTKKVVEVKSI
jgi:23S rRNA pseudouridine1911/1915/1917 synthase